MAELSQIAKLVADVAAPWGVAHAVAPVRMNDPAGALSQDALTHLRGVELSLFNGIGSLKRRAEFCAGRIAARKALSTTSLAGISFEVGRGRAGEPYIALPARSGLHVSISHSNGFAAAVVSHSPVGFDLELVEERPQAFVERFLSETERIALLTLPAGERTQYINRLWSRKEAACKVGGWGSTVPFSGIDCDLSATRIEGHEIHLVSSEGAGFVASIARFDQALDLHERGRALRPVHVRPYPIAPAHGGYFNGSG